MKPRCEKRLSGISTFERYDGKEEKTVGIRGMKVSENKEAIARIKANEYSSSD